MQSILCIGHSTYDITIPMPNYPVENIKYRIKNIVESGGGPANNAAYLLAKWEVKTYYAGSVGNDLYGNRIKKELTDGGVDTTYLEVKDNMRTSTSYIIANLENGSRTILGHPNLDMICTNQNIALNPAVILVDGYHYELAKQTLINNPDAISILDAGRVTKETLSLGSMVDYLVCSRDFAEQFCRQKIDINNKDILRLIYNNMAASFKTNIIITLGAKGCLYYKNNDVKILPPYQVKAVDSTGAGDIFHGAFAYGLFHHYDLEKTLRIASIAGALSVTKIGSKQSMPALQTVMEIYQHVD